MDVTSAGSFDDAEPRPQTGDPETIARALAPIQPFGALSCLPDWTIVDASEPVLELLRMDRDEVVGRRFANLLAGPDRIFHETHHAPLVQLHGIARELSVDLQTADGTRQPVLLTTLLVRDGDGAEVGIRIGVVDASNRRNYEDKLRLARQRAQAAAARRWSHAGPARSPRSRATTGARVDPRHGRPRSADTVVHHRGLRPDVAVRCCK